MLANDWTISYRKQVFQILKLNRPLPKPKTKITVRIWRDGSIHLLYRDKPLRGAQVALQRCPILPSGTKSVSCKTPHRWGHFH